MSCGILAKGEEDSHLQIFEGEYDQDGVFFYQAFCDDIAEWSIKNQCLGGERFNPKRMTWIKPSFGWMLYRSGYGSKHNQTRVLKLKISHESLAYILQRCQCSHGRGGSLGRVQWDPARDLWSPDGREPRKMLRKRAIQIGIKGPLSEYYLRSILSIEDVTELAQDVGRAHLLLGSKKDPFKPGEGPMQLLAPRLPDERSYLPCCPPATLQQLGMLSGETAEMVYGLGKGKAIQPSTLK